MTDAVGVDGWRGGWVAAAVTGSRLCWSSHPTLADVIDRYPGAHVGVDIPIGLPRSGYRDCDLAARKFLGPARSSIFLTPTRTQVTRWAPGAPHPIGAGISRQMWNILGKVVEVDELVKTVGQERIAEVHPECSFRTLAGSPFASKKTGRGAGQRMDALNTWVRLPELSQAPPEVPMDDLLDAAVVAWTTQRWREQSAHLIEFGTHPTDAHGLTMSIIA